MDKIKLCKDCVHQRYGSYYVEAKGIANGSYCVANVKIRTSVSLVTGREELYPSEIPVGCEQERSCYGRCGSDAKLFRAYPPLPPRKSLWQRVKGWL